MDRETDGFEPERFAMFDIERWMGSDTYAGTSGSERRLLVPFFLWQSQNGPIIDDGFLLYRIAYADEAEAGSEFLARLRAVLTKAFKLTGREWTNRTAMAAFEKHRVKARGRSEKASHAAKSRWDKEKAELSTSEQCPEDARSIAASNAPISSPLLSSPLSVVVEPVQESFLTMVEPQVVKPRRAQRVGWDLALLFLRASYERTKRTAEPFPEPSKGTVAKAEKMIDALLAQGKERELLVSLPALIENDMVPALLERNPFALLSDGSDPRTNAAGQTIGATDHAASMGAKLHRIVIGERQESILKAIGTHEWALAHGVAVHRRNPVA